MDNVFKGEIKNACEALVVGGVGSLIVLAFHNILMKLMLNSEMASLTPSSPMFFTALVYVITGFMACFLMFIVFATLTFKRKTRVKS